MCVRARALKTKRIEMRIRMRRQTKKTHSRISVSVSVCVADKKQPNQKWETHEKSEKKNKKCTNKKVRVTAVPQIYIFGYSKEMHDDECSALPFGCWKWTHSATVAIVNNREWSKTAKPASTPTAKIYSFLNSSCASPLTLLSRAISLFSPPPPPSSLSTGQFVFARVLLNASI